MQDVQDQDIVESTAPRSPLRPKQSFKAMMLNVQNSCRATWRKARGLPKRTQWITAIGVGAVVIVTLGWMVVASHHSRSAAFATPVTLDNGVVGEGAGASSLRLQLNDIQTQLSSLQNQQASGADLNQELAQLTQSMASLQQEVSNLKASSPETVAQIQTAVAESHQDLQQQLSSIQSTMQSLKNQMAPKHYLPASVLPWAVVGVDVRNHQKVVVRADGFSPIHIGEVRDGWRLIKVQFYPPLAIFENVALPSQYVKAV